MNDITEQEMTRYFSNNLRLLRNGRTPPISQQQLANQLHVDRGLIAKYECGLLLPPVHLAFLISRLIIMHAIQKQINWQRKVEQTIHYSPSKSVCF